MWDYVILTIVLYNTHVSQGFTTVVLEYKSYVVYCTINCNGRYNIVLAHIIITNVYCKQMLLLCLYNMM